MLKKLRILSNNIPKEYNEGFIIDYKKNKIVNISKNYSIKIPFKIIKSDLFSFELLIENSIVNLNFILDTLCLKSNQFDLEYIKNKTYIFSILRCAFKNIKLSNNINRYYDLKDIILKKPNYILRNNIIKLDNIYFNLEKESIFTEDSENLVYLKPKLYIIYGNINNYNMPKNYKLCIIDDKYKLDQNSLIISFDNYELIDYEIIQKFTTIGICKEFFLSNEYFKMYKYFHSNYRSEYAYDNYKNYMKKNNYRENIYNLELLDNIIFMINNICKKTLIKHPVINSDNYIIIINNKIDEYDLRNSYKLISYKYNKSKVNTELIMNNQLYYDRTKYTLSKLFNNNEIDVLKTKFYFEGIDNEYSVYHHHIQDICPIARESIDNKTYIKFNCGHSFSYDGIDYYLSKNKKCPYCNVDIRSLNIYFFNNNVIQYILDIKDDDKDIYFFYKDDNNFTKFISNYCFYSSKLDNDIINIEIEPYSIIVLDINISEHDFCNIQIINPVILDTIKLIKLDFYY